MVKMTNKSAAKGGTAAEAKKTTKETPSKKTAANKTAVNKKAAAKKKAATKQTAAAKKPAARNKTAAKRATTGASASAEATVRAISTAQRHQLIAEAAYLRSESKGFPGDAHEDWLIAEADVDARLRKAGIKVGA